MIRVEPHPLLDLAAFETLFPRPLAAFGNPLPLPVLLTRQVPFGPADPTPVRDLLRHGGFKPAGRSKPASEYVRAAVPEGRLGAINAAVDACNAASYFSGLPISVIDLDLAAPPLRIGIAPGNTSYVFNAGGQEIRVDGLLCLFDANGPCANAVKDSQRTKTSDATTRTLTVIWGTKALFGRAAETATCYRAWLFEAGATTAEVVPGPDPR